MLKNILLLLFFFLIAGCDDQDKTVANKTNDIGTTNAKFFNNARTRKDNMSMVSIKDLKMSDSTLVVSFTIKNSLEHDVWICKDLDIYGNHEVVTQVDKEVIFIKFYLKHPPDALLYQAIRSRYVRLPTNKQVDRELTLKLPIRNSSPFVPVIIENPSLKKASKVVLQIGYFEDPLLCIPDPLVQVVSDNEIIMEHLWEGKKHEKLFETSIVLSDMKIPCYLE